MLYCCKICLLIDSMLLAIWLCICSNTLVQRMRIQLRPKCTPPIVLIDPARLWVLAALWLLLVGKEISSQYLEVSPHSVMQSWSCHICCSTAVLASPVLSAKFKLWISIFELLRWQRSQMGPCLLSSRSSPSRDLLDAAYSANNASNCCESGTKNILQNIYKFHDPDSKPL